MSVYRKDTQIESYPAYAIVERTPAINGGINLMSDETLGLKKEFRGETYYATFCINSVASYAIENGECPMEATNHAIENDHKLHYIFSLGASISSGPVEQKKVVKVEVGMLVNFQGHAFKITSEPNDNLGLRKVDA